MSSSKIVPHLTPKPDCLQIKFCSLMVHSCITMSLGKSWIYSGKDPFFVDVSFNIIFEVCCNVFDKMVCAKTEDQGIWAERKVMYISSMYNFRIYSRWLSLPNCFF